MARKRSKVTRVTSKEERKRGNLFLRLKQEESFVAVALFEPDPEMKNNAGYIEYYDFWDQEAKQYVPASEDTSKYFTGQNTSSRALTVWYFPDNDVGDQFKVFTFNWGMIQEAADLLEDEDGIMGSTLRVVRLDDRGSYRIRLRKDKALTQSAVKKLIADDAFPDLEELLEQQHDRQLQRLMAMEIIEEGDDDDEDEEEEAPKAPKARRGKKKEEPVAEEEDEEEDENEEDEDEEDEEDEDEESSENSLELENATVSVVEVDENNETFRIEVNGEDVDLWLNSDVDIVWDDFKKVKKITIDAVEDEEGDLVATSIKKARGRAAAKKK